MELRDLRYFCMVAELEHVSKAADKLGTSQPFLTKIIGQLEDELGVKLFDKVSRHIRLNQNGRYFYERVNGILNDLDTLKDEMDNLSDTQQREIRLITDHAGYLSDLILDYKSKNPESMISVTYSKRAAIIDAIATGTADYAFTSPPISHMENEHIISEPVFHERGCILIPPSCPLSGRKKVTTREVVDYPMVASPKGAGIRSNIDSFYAEKAHKPCIVCESMDIELNIKAAMNGLGLTLLPHYYLNDEAVGQYCAEIDDAEAVAVIGLSYNKNRAGMQSTKLFTEIVRNFYSKLEKLHG